MLTTEHISLSQKSLMSIKIFARNSRAGNGCANFYGRLGISGSLCRKTTIHTKFLVLGGGGGAFWFFGGGGANFILWARGFFAFSDSIIKRTSAIRSPKCSHPLTLGKVQRAYPQTALGRSTECREFPDFSGCFLGVFWVFSGSFRVLSGCFSLCPFRVCPLDPSILI